MKVKLVYPDDAMGIELTAENEEEDKTLARFWAGGVKVNSITPRSDNSTSLQLNFADLIEE